MREPEQRNDPAASSPANEGGETLPRRKTSRLQRRFVLGLTCIFVSFCVLSAFLIYWHEKNLLVDAIHRKSQLVMAAFEANRRYVREVLRPKMYQILGDQAFVLEAMSTSYVGREVMKRFKESMPQYHYRRVALHARNPDSDPTPFERKLILYFAAHPDQRIRRGIMEIAGRSYFVHCQPVYFKPSCMHCHGNPADAPAPLIARYGPQRGFGHHPGEIAGVNLVSIPVDVALAEIKGRAFSVFWVGLLCLFMLYFMVSVYFNRLVVHNLKDLLQVFRDNLRSEDEMKLLREAEAKDEIDELTTSARVMAAHLRDTRRKLEQYAANLEKMVAERTRALEKSEQRLREKVTARNRELHTLNVIAELITRSVSLADMIPQVLKQTLRTVPGQGIALYLLQERPLRLELQCEENAGDLPARIAIDDLPGGGKPNAFSSSLGEAGCGFMSFFPAEEEQRGGLNIPLCCRGRVLGVMSLVGLDLVEITPEMEQLLFSIGKQVGITIESLQNTERLVKSKELLQLVFDGITDLVMFLDRDSRIKMVNMAYLKRTGKRIEDVVGRRCRDLHEGTFCPCEQCGLPDVFTSKAPFSEEVKNNKGEIFQVNYYPIVDDQGEVSSVIRYAREITAQKRVEQRIQQADKLVSLGQLAAGIAHEINNPLGVILCYTDLLKRQLADFPSGLKDVATIEKHALNCQRIVADLLKLTRGQGDSRQLLPLNRTLEEVVRMLHQQLRRRRIEVEMDLATDLPLVNIDADKIKQVYLNMLMNAQQAMDGKGLIRIRSRYRRESAMVEISFWDNGKGIAPEHIHKVFDPFFSTKDAGEGTGLGLSVSYGIVQDHEGEIAVESESGQWTRFTVRLPVDDRCRQQRPCSQARNGEGHSTG